MIFAPQRPASGSPAAFVKRVALAFLVTTTALPPASAQAQFGSEFSFPTADRADEPTLGDARTPPDVNDAKARAFRMSMLLRPEPSSWLTPYTRARRLTLREFTEGEAPQAMPVRLIWDETESQDWRGLRRVLLRFLSGARNYRFERGGIWAQSERGFDPAHPPGVVADASLAARVRARLVGEPELRGFGTVVECREGRVQIHARLPDCQRTGRALTLALSVDGVREVRIDTPVDLAREIAAGR